MAAIKKHSITMSRRQRTVQLEFGIRGRGEIPLHPGRTKRARGDETLPVTNHLRQVEPATAVVCTLKERMGAGSIKHDPGVLQCVAKQVEADVAPVTKAALELWQFFGNFPADSCL